MDETKDIQNEVTTTPMEKSKLQRVVEGLLVLLGLDGLVSYAQVLKNVFIVLLVVFLGIVEIFNTHLAERLTRQINEKKQYIKELRWEFMTENAVKNEKTKQSEIQKIIGENSVKSAQEPPKKVEIDK